MARFITIQGEEFPVPEEGDLSYGELFVFEQATGLRGETLSLALQEGSIGGLIGMASIVLRRAKRDVNLDDLFNLKAGELKMRSDEDDSEDPSVPDVDDTVGPDDRPATN